MLKSTSNNSLEHTFLGTVDFESAFKIQRSLWASAKVKNQVSIMGLDHPAVITLGRRAELSMPVLGLPVVQSTRGGLVTLHSEGQLVIYTILNLKEHHLGVKDFVLKLLETTQKTFADFGVVTFIDDQRIGLYTDHGKIAFCGLEIKEGVSQHGISINISNDLKLFNHIESCGIQKMAMDKLQYYRFDVDMKQFFMAWVENFNSCLVPL